MRHILTLTFFYSTFLLVSSAAAAGASAQGPGGQWGTILDVDGTQAFGQLGAAIASAGDVNGDGCDDLLVGEPYRDEAGYTAIGAVHVISGLDGTLLRTIFGESPGDHFGAAVASLGDLDGDGITDHLVGAPEGGGAPLYAGTVSVFSGADGSRLLQVSGYFNKGRLGESLAAAGDLNGDGHPDFLAGAPDAKPAGYSGAAYAFSGLGGLIRGWSGESNTGKFGWRIAAAGDVDGDGVADVLVSAPLYGSNQGMVYLYSGASGQQITLRLGGVGDYQGHGLAGAGDVDGDGVPDFAVGSPGTPAGAVEIVSGASFAVLRFLEGSRPGDAFGYNLAEVGDVNLDGVPELAIAAPSAYPVGISLFDGATGAVLTRVDGTQGLAMGGGADLQGDGIPELLIGEPGRFVGPIGPEGGFFVYGWDPFVIALSATASASAASLTTLLLDFPDDAGRESFHLLLSGTGRGPTNVAGVQVPLTLDALFLRTFAGNYGMFDWISQGTGQLNAYGEATIYYYFNAGSLASVVGRTFHLAAVSIGAANAVHYSTAAISITVQP